MHADGLIVSVLFLLCFLKVCNVILLASFPQLSSSFPPPSFLILSKPADLVLLLTLVIGDRITACTFSHSVWSCSHLCIACSDKRALKKLLRQSCFVVMSTSVVQPSVFIINRPDNQHVFHLLTLQCLPLFLTLTGAAYTSPLHHCWLCLPSGQATTLAVKRPVTWLL